MVDSAREMISGAGAVRRRRADASANRRSLIQSARRIFGEFGPAASLDSISTDAGVGNATLYRHFPRREDLYAAAVMARLAEVESYLDRVEQEADPWTAFESYVRFLASTPDNFLEETLLDLDAENEEIRDKRLAMRARISSIFARAQATGVLRPDVDLVDLNVFLFAHGKVAPPTTSTMRSERLLQHYIDGLRSGGSASAANSG